MSTDRPDLPAALTQIADGATHTTRQTGAGLDLTHIHTTARRRRIRFGTGVGMAAAAAVATLVLGAATAGGLINHAPLPPVQTPDSAGWDVDYSLCGQGSPNWGNAAGPAILVPKGAPQADSDALVTVSTGTALLAGDDAPETIQRVGTRHDAVALEPNNGTVVGVLGVPVGGSSDDLVPFTEETAFLTTTAPLFSCQNQDGHTRLEAGDYSLNVSQRVELLVDGVVEEQLLATGPLLTIPESASGDSEALPAIPLAGAAPECGEVLAPPATGASQVLVRLDLSDPSGVTSPLDAGQRLPVDATLTLIDEGGETAQPRELAGGSPRAILTLDGVVAAVATGGTPGTGLGGTDGDPVPLVPGTTRRSMESFTSGCPDGTPGTRDGLAVGTYETWAVVSFTDGTALVAGPWPFAVDSVDLAGPAAEPDTQDYWEVDDLVISLDGLGPLAIGTIVPRAPTSPPLLWFDEGACPGTQTPGRWVTSYPERPGPRGEPLVAYTVRESDDHFNRINVQTAGPHTQEGIQVGSTLADLRAAYPDVELMRPAVETGWPIDAWGIQDGDRSLVFEVSTTAGSSDSGELDQIVAIVISTGIPYDYPAWGANICD